VNERLPCLTIGSPAQSRRILDETGFCFLFAPLYHPGLKHAGPVRRQLKVRTIMNVLGPCLNPAEPPVQLLGVADPTLLRPVASTLAALGVRTALVVHGAGLDEIALHGRTYGVRLEGNRTERVRLSPEQAGLARAPADAAKGGDPEENARRLDTLLRGRAPRAEADLIAINAGALLMTAGLATTLKEGTAIASDTLASGAPGRILEAYVEASRG
jgi:anthranilate phosphoribosyltransferase